MTSLNLRLRCLLSLLLVVFLQGCAGGGSGSGSNPSGGTTTPTQTTLTVTGISPTKIQAGASDLTLTITGTGFQQSTQLQLAGATVTSAYVSGTQMTALVPAKSLTNGALLTVVAMNGSTTSSSPANALSLEVDNPVPQVTGFSPSSLMAAAGSSTMSLSGSGFVPSSVVQINGTPRPTAFGNSGQVTFTVTDEDLASGGSLNLTVFNPAPAGGTSSAASVPVLYPLPSLVSLSPSSVPQGNTSAKTITVTGTNFMSGSVAMVNGSARPTSVLNNSQLTFDLSVADQATAGTVSVTITNPTPGGGTSSAATLTIAKSTPSSVVSSVTPTQFVVNTAASFTVQATNISASSVVNWNGTPLTTTYTSYTVSNATYYYLVATLPASLVPAVGTASVTVTNPTSAPSNAITVQVVNPPVPVLTSIAPNGTPLGTGTTVTVTGTSFTSSSSVFWDGVAQPTTFKNSATLTFQVAASQVTLPGNHQVTVSTPAPGGGASAPAGFTAYISIPTNAMVKHPTNGLLYVSVPGSAGPPYGNTVVSVDPATGTFGKPILVGSEPNKLAISSDGTTMWVGLDGVSAVQKVDLTTGTLGMQFSLGGGVGTYSYTPVVHAIAVLPGTTNSVAISALASPYLYEDYLTIYDNGVARTNNALLSTVGTMPAIAVDPSQSLLYATSYESGYQVFSYDSTGLHHQAGDSGTAVLDGNYGSALQIDRGRAYLNLGKVLNSADGTLLGTFYSAGTTVAVGPIVSDSAQGKVFILNVPPTYYYGTPVTATIQAFRQSDFTAIANASIPMGGAMVGTKYGGGGSSVTAFNASNGIDTLVRWGSNGLAFRAANGIFSVRSNVVQDLSNTNADLAVAVNTPASATTGTSYTATINVTNNGPSAATAVALSGVLPTNALQVSTSSSVGNCTAVNTLTCSLGNLASGASATITVVLKGTDNGSATIAANVQAGENDPTSSNNSASASTTLSGGTYAAVPRIGAIAPNAAALGSDDVTVTVSGAGFISGSVVNWNGTALNTSVVSSTQLKATVPAASLKTLSWASITVSTPAPGGGLSAALPFTVYNVLKLTANRIAVEPFTGKLYATVNSAATETTGNSLVTVDPVGGTFSTGISIGSQPTKMAFTDSGNYMYVLQTGATSVGRYNLQTKTLDFSFPVSTTDGTSSAGYTPRDLAVVPGSETSLSVDLGSWPGIAMYDVNPTSHTATTRTGTYGQNATGPYTGSSLQFLNSNTMFSFNIDTTGGTLNKFSVASTGLVGSSQQQYTLNSFNSFSLKNGIGYANAGGVANLGLPMPASLGVFLHTASNITASTTSTSSQLTAPDPSLGRSFFALTTAQGSAPTQQTFYAFDQKSYQQTDALTTTVTGSTATSSSITDVDFVRWGQDGLALLQSDGYIVFLRGPFVVPGLMWQNAAATLTSASSNMLTHGSGNVTLTFTGTGFLPGMAVLWNGSYRTTTLVDSTHAAVAIPASDLASAGSATVTAVNPGASASTGLTITIQ
ncbi:beta strand repeat-containing protein [Terriglobus roseus]|uniref:IPT/TIG domain-containing protein n=1 Tax=Terriglobus roseus TaxID=392734 RepID=A0A1G7PWN2_9BACT|nr:DUF11 domain-containing protein [Terriglobus roseus]SDF90676.1 IPT/TIG domain-containing protein [Terriglobus roseus]